MAEDLEQELRDIVEEGQALLENWPVHVRRPVDGLTYNSMVQSLLNEEQKLRELERKHNLFSSTSNTNGYEYANHDAI